jgi:hypothetical protein
MKIISVKRERDWEVECRHSYRHSYAMDYGTGNILRRINPRECREFTTVWSLQTSGGKTRIEHNPVSPNLGISAKHHGGMQEEKPEMRGSCGEHDEELRY